MPFLLDPAPKYTRDPAAVLTLLAAAAAFLCDAGAALVSEPLCTCV
jgi:hypothetical protein